MTSEREKALAGEPYQTRDPDLLALHRRALGLCRDLEKADTVEAMAATLGALLGSAGKGVWIAPRFHCDYGVNIHIADDVFVNVNCVFLDGAEIHIGAGALIGPAVQILTVTHPVPASERMIRHADGSRGYTTFAKPITIGEEAWIGAGALILPGATIGARSVVAAGSVVTQDIPPDTIAGGNPARALKTSGE
ncbi:MAG: sugar O-acetyltransferase [Pseudomonadota bacterium]